MKNGASRWRTARHKSLSLWSFWNGSNMHCSRKNNILSLSRKRTSYMTRRTMMRLAITQNPPTPQEKKEANESSYEVSSVGMVQPAALPSASSHLKGEALAMMKALAAGEYEAMRGVTAWYRLTRDHRGSSAQRFLGLVKRVFQPQRCQKMSNILSHVELLAKSHSGVPEVGPPHGQNPDKSARQLQSFHRPQLGIQRLGKRPIEGSSQRELQSYQGVYLGASESQEGCSL